MSDGISRRGFLGGMAMGVAAAGMERALVGGAVAAAPAATPAKARIATVYYGREHPGWPMATVDVKEEFKRVEAELAKVAPTIPDVEFINCGLVTNAADLTEAKAKMQGADGILVMQLTMGLGTVIGGLMDLNLPIVLFAEPYCGHEWHTIAAWQRQGKRIDCWASSKFADVEPALRPIRAMRRLKDAKVLFVSQRGPQAEYVQAVQEKFGTRIEWFKPEDLEAAYQAVEEAAAAAEADQWKRGALKIVEPSQDDILKASRMSLALQRIVTAQQAAAITINCLGMGLIQRGMGYPCLGFARLSSIGSGGICEADLKSTMTHLIFLYLANRPGFVTDPCFDYSDNTIIHAHCVSPVKMLGPDGPSHPYYIRSHLEDNQGAVLQVKLPVGQKVSMARLIGTDVMLFSTGDAVDSPLVDRGCRTKLTVRVEHPEKFLEGWSCGLHRVVFYGDHTRDVERFCRLFQIRMVREGTDDVRDIPGLDWGSKIHA